MLTYRIIIDIFDEGCRDKILAYLSRTGSLKSFQLLNSLDTPELAATAPVPHPLALPVRNDEIIALYLEDPRKNSSGKLAAKYGVSRERICQILRRGNAIGYAQERRKIAADILATTTAEAKEAATKAVTEKLQQALQLMHGGASQRQALKAVGFGHHHHHAHTLGRMALVAGIKPQHGRHRDFSKRVARVRELSSQGFTIPEIVAKMRAEDDPHVHEAWVYKHVPEARVRSPLRQEPRNQQ